MYNYQQYLSPHRSLLGSAGPGYEYQMGQDFPQHLRDWQQNDYTLQAPEMQPWKAPPFGARYRTPGGVPYQAPVRMQAPEWARVNYTWGGYRPPNQPISGGPKFWGGNYQNALNYQAAMRPSIGYF